MQNMYSSKLTSKLQVHVNIKNTTYLKKGLANSVDSDEIAHMSHLIWIYTAKYPFSFFSQSQFLNF